jgi:hypothetical protein
LRLPSHRPTLADLTCTVCVQIPFVIGHLPVGLVDTRLLLCELPNVHIRRRPVNFDLDKRNILAAWNLVDANDPDAHSDRVAAREYPA